MSREMGQEGARAKLRGVRWGGHQGSHACRQAGAEPLMRFEGPVPVSMGRPESEPVTKLNVFNLRICFDFSFLLTFLVFFYFYKVMLIDELFLSL